MKKESSKNKNEVVSKIDKKQLIVGIIILLVAILTLTYAFMGAGDKGDNKANIASVTQTEQGKRTAAKSQAVENEEDVDAKEYERVVVDKEKPHVSLALTVTIENDVEYVVSFTTEEEIYFNGRNVVSQQIKKGTADYVIDFPVEKIKSFRLDMGLNSGNMVVKNMKLVGTQEEDISSPMYYEMLGRIDIGQDKSFVINDKNVPALIYHPEFKERQENEAKARAEAKVKAEEEAKAKAEAEAANAETKAEVKEEAKAEE